MPVAAPEPLVVPRWTGVLQECGATTVRLEERLVTTRALSQLKNPLNLITHKRTVHLAAK
jgi:hypothetical protein